MAMFAAPFFLAALLCLPARGADKDKEKKPEKEKKEKIEPWVEIRTPHFIVAADGGEKTARRIAEEFESLVRVIQATMPNSRVSSGIPVRIVAPRDAKSFGRAFPDFPYDKNHEQPPGLFFSGPEKTYIGVRTNASGHFPYMEIFQNYGREILKRSYRNLPPWLEEGYSTVYGDVTFGDRGPRLERPDPEDLSVLYESPLLPLDLVLHVDRASPYYSPGNKQSVYFAESRVLVHFLISDPQFTGAKSLERYITAVQNGGDSLQAAREAFGDLNQLQSKLDAYVKQVNGQPAELPVSGGGGDSAGSARTLSAAQIEARTADFLALRGRNEDAQDKLEEAIMSEPGLAEAEQSLGFILLKKNDVDEAQKHFDRAVQLDSNDALNFYGQGLAAVAKAGNAAVPPGAVDAFEKTVSLNPDFAPGWENLAMLYSQRNEMLAKALADAKRAAALAPGESRYQSAVAALQDRLANPGDARRASASGPQSANDRAGADKSGDLAARISPRQPPAAPPPSTNPPAKPATADPGLRIERKTEPEAKPSTASTVSAAPKPEPPPAPAAPLFSPTKVYSMMGTITDVNCSNAPQIFLTMKSLTIVMKLHAAELAKLSFKSAGSESALKEASCSSLRGRSARVSYTLVLNQPWDGEMQEVEFRSQP